MASGKLPLKQMDEIIFFERTAISMSLQFFFIFGVDLTPYKDMKYEVKQQQQFQYIEEGEGPVLLLLHGLFGALSNWEMVLNCFAANYKVIIPLMPISQMPLPETNLAGLGDYIHRFVEMRRYPPFTLLGNSLGGHVALIYVLEHPERVHSMVLTGSSGLYENAMGGSFPRRNSYEFIKEKTEFTFYDPKIATKELVDEVYDTVNSRNKGIRIVMMAKSAIRHNMEKELKNIKVPVCLIWGREDRITPPEVAEEFHQLLPNSELHFIDFCGHAPMMERPDIFNDILQDFLNKVYVTL